MLRILSLSLRKTFLLKATAGAKPIVGVLFYKTLFLAVHATGLAFPCIVSFFVAFSKPFCRSFELNFCIQLLLNGNQPEANGPFTSSTVRAVSSLFRYTLTTSERTASTVNWNKAVRASID
jgi:hypothetical protein